MKLLRRIVLLATLLGVVGAIAWAYRPQALLVSVSTVSRGPLDVGIEEEGQTRIRERYVVTPPVAGYVTRLSLHAGDPVAAGAVLFTLAPVPPSSLDARARAQAEARVAGAAAGVRAAETDATAAAANATWATRELGRLRPLLDTGAVPKTDYDRVAAEAERADAMLKSARAAVDVARHELDAARTALRYSAASGPAATERIRVVSPVSGRVLSVLREDEGVVAAGTPVLAVGDPRSLEVFVDVLSSDAVRIRPGMDVWLERWGGDAPLEARVRTVEPTAFTKVSALGVEEQRVRVVADLVSPPEAWSRLGDGYRVEARFVIWHDDAALRVPHSSLFRVGEGWAVFVVDEGRAVRRRVSVGQRGALHAQVLEGLSAGQTVITYPDDRLADGTRVGVRETEAP